VIIKETSEQDLMNLVLEAIGLRLKNNLKDPRGEIPALPREVRDALTKLGLDPENIEGMKPMDAQEFVLKFNK
jgi:hypothetical protein